MRKFEKEMLAIVFGLEKFERYMFGRHVEVESDLNYSFRFTK